MNRKLILSFFVLLSHSLFAQNKTDFSFIDKYGILIKVQGLSNFSSPIDSAFIVANIDSKLIEPGLDSAKYNYVFWISKIALSGRNEFEVEVYSESISKPIIGKDSTVIILYKTKRTASSGVNIYKMQIKQVSDKYVISNFIYFISKI